MAKNTMARKELGDWNRTGYDDTNWIPAGRVSIPSGTLRAQMMPGMKVTESLKPVSIRKQGDKQILDIGQNMAGWLRIRIKGQAGDSIRLRFAERLQPDGEIFTKNLRDAHCTDIYVVSGREPQDATWAPRFVYHGFRYVEISGYPNAKTEDFTAEVVDDEMAHTGTFTCSDETLNQVLRNAFWGIRSNYKGMPVDCPQRNERQPWLGDHAMGSWGESLFFNNHALYNKWTRDIREAQREDGCIPDVAPAYWNYYSDNVTWPATLPLVCDMLFTNYGDRRAIEENYPALKKWVSHIREYYLTKEFIITKDKYGDWCVPPESLEMIHSNDPVRKTDGALIATAYYLKVLQLMHRFASLQGLTAEAEEWGTLEGRIKDAFNARFLHVKEGTSPVPDILYIRTASSTVTTRLPPIFCRLLSDLSPNSTWTKLPRIPWLPLSLPIKDISAPESSVHNGCYAN